MGVDTDKAIETPKSLSVSLHCWQGNDVMGFDHNGTLTGGLQTTGNYPEKAKTPEELMADLDFAIKLMLGKKKLNIEVVLNKIPALLAFFPEIALHITRPIRWDSDHVVIFDDKTKEMAKVNCPNLYRHHKKGTMVVSFILP